jgi:hypothetical protein
MRGSRAVGVAVCLWCGCASGGSGTSDGDGTGPHDEAAGDVDVGCDPAACDGACRAAGALGGACRAGTCECLGGGDGDADADGTGDDGAGDDAGGDDGGADDAEPEDGGPEDEGPDGLTVDDDGDTFAERDGDCDDTDPTIFPGATEFHEGVDYDCDTRLEYRATIVITADDAYDLCVDGVAVASGSDHSGAETYELVLDAGRHVVGVHGYDTAGVTAGLAAWIGVAGMEIKTDGVLATEPDTTQWRYYPSEVEDPQATWCDIGFDDSAWGPALFNAEQDDGEWLANPNELRGRDVEWIWDGRPRDLREAWFRRRIELPNEPRPVAPPGVEVCTTAAAPINLIARATDRLHNGVALAWTGTEYGAVWDQWYDAWRAGCDQLFFQRISSAGAALGTPVQLTTGTWWNTFPDMAWGASTYAILNEDAQLDRAGDQIYLVRADAAGVELGTDTALTAAPSVFAGYPAVAFDGTDFAGVWEDDRDDVAGAFEISFVRFSPAGTLVGSRLRVTDSPGASRTPDIAWGGTQWGVVWEDVRGGESEVFFARVSSAGAKVGGDVLVSASPGESTAPAIAWSGTEWGVAWDDERDGNREIYFALVADDGTVEAPIRVTTDGAISSTPSLVWNGTGWTVAWRDARDGNDEIYLTRVDAGGARLEDDTRVTTSDGRSWHPDLVWTGTEYGLLWEEETAPATEPYFFRPQFVRVSCP